MKEIAEEYGEGILAFMGSVLMIAIIGKILLGTTGGIAQLILIWC